MPVHQVTRSYVCSRLQPTFPPGFRSLTTAFGAMVRRTSAPVRGPPWGAIRRVMDSPCLSATGVRFLRPPVPAAGLTHSCEGITGACPRPQRGCHVPHRQAALGELASRRRERGTVSASALTLADHGSSKDVATPFVPSHHDGASTKASRRFNSVPTFPGIDFGWGSLLSFGGYGLLETPRLLATPRPYGNRRSVLAWPGLILDDPDT
jgi:hypothetical protein